MSQSYRPSPGRSRLLLAIVAVAALTACGSDSGGPPSDDEAAESGAGKMVVTTTDGQTMVFQDFKTYCFESPTQPNQRVVSADAGLGAEPTGFPDQPILMLRAGDVVADGKKVNLPHAEVAGREKSFISLFLTRAGKVEQLSAGAEGSKGTVEVISASCEPTPRIDVRIDATLHSENYHGGNVTIEGHLQSK